MWAWIALALLVGLIYGWLWAWLFRRSRWILIVAGAASYAAGAAAVLRFEEDRYVGEAHGSGILFGALILASALAIGAAIAAIVRTHFLAGFFAAGVLLFGCGAAAVLAREVRARMLYAASAETFAADARRASFAQQAVVFGFGLCASGAAAAVLRKARSKRP